MNSQYPAIYRDIHGQEEAILEMEPHEGFLLTVRGVSFRSYDLDTFGIWPLDQKQEKWHSFQVDREGDLVECTLQWTMPVQIHQGSQITQGSLHCTLERSKPTEKHRYGFVQIHVVLQIADITCEVTNNDTTMGTNLFKLQKQLPRDISLNCCQFCALPQDDFYGPGILCYRHAKEQIHVVKHLTVRRKLHYILCYAAKREERERLPAPKCQSAPRDIQVGTILAERYQIEEEIGRGGFSLVYRAIDLHEKKRRVAIKRIPLSTLTPEQIIGVTETFNREVQMLSRFKGMRGIPRLYEHLTDPENWYLVMEYIPGSTLEEFLQHRPGGYLNEEETLRVGVRLAQLLQGLHTDEPLVVFRDVKPANIMFTPRQELFLIDFGIARTFTAEKTKDTTPLGSPGYAAPEQYGRDQTDQRADVYSLGTTLQTIFTGRDPLELAAGEPSRNPKRPSPALRKILDEMLAPEVELRPTDMQAVQAKLRAIQVSPTYSAPTSNLYGLLVGAGMALFSTLQSALKQFTWVFILLAICIVLLSLILSIYEIWSQKTKLVGWKVFTRPAPLGIFTALLIWILLEWLGWL